MEKRKRMPVDNMPKLAIVTTHPIQYYAPVFQLLHQRNVISITVFYTWGQESMNKFDPGFGKMIDWDIPLLEGYPFEWVENISTKPGSHHFKGIVNPDLIAQLNQLKPDAILFFGWAWKSHLKAIRYFKNKIPVYFRGDSTLLDKPNGIKGLLRNVFLKWVYRHIDHAFYTGANNKDYFKKFGLRNDQLTFAPHAIDNDRFGAINNEEAETLRNNLGLDAGDILILYAGKFEEKKDPLLLLNAFLQLKRNDCHLLFVGNGNLEGELKQKAQNAGNVHFMGFQNQAYMPVIYHACNLFCLPSKGPGESWGLAVNEAMASGKAVLVSDKAGCAVDLVKNKFNGSIFRHKNIDDLKQKLDELMASRQLLNTYGANSTNVISDWNFANIAIAIETRLLNEKKRQD